MRGAGDELSVGERVAFYRARRGLTQAALAGLVGRSEEWVSSIERGRRPVRRLDVLKDLASALRVELPDLLGQPVLIEDDEGNDDISAVRDALMSPRRLSRLLYRPAEDEPSEPADPQREERYVEQVWFEFQAGRVGRVVAALPQLIATAHRLEEAPGEARLGWAISARIHHLASTTMSKVGESDLAWIAAERAMYAAEQADNPLVLASAARAGTHAFLANGRYGDAMDLGTTASRWLQERMDDSDPAALSLFGMLQLRMATASSRRQDRSATAELLRQAQAAAERLGQDANYWQTNFGPTNVQIHRLSAALELGDVAYVVEHATDVDASHLPAERRAARLIDAARALSLVARDDEALSNLLDAEQVAPQLVRQNPTVREMVKTIYRRSPATGQRRSSPLMALALRCRAVT